MSTAVLQLDYVPMDQIAARGASWWRNVLGVVGFSKPPPIGADEVPVAASMTPSLGTAAGNLCEVWRVAGPVDSELSSRHGRVHYRFCDDYLFGTVTLEEQSFGECVDSTALSQATISAYRDIFEVLETNRASAPDPRVELSPGDQSRGGRRRALSPFQHARGRPHSAASAGRRKSPCPRLARSARRQEARYRSISSPRARRRR